jgi:hypothetical protein
MNNYKIEKDLNLIVYITIYKEWIVIIYFKWLVSNRCIRILLT